MKTAIMQPYFFPYIAYFQLIDSVDLFILYDNVKYTKKGWINRNRILLNGEPTVFSLPLKSASDFVDVRDRQLAVGLDRDELVNKIYGAYRKAPYFAEVIPIIESILRQDETNLFKFLLDSIGTLCKALRITTDIRVSSEISINHELKHDERVLALCEAVNTDTYVNAIGGMQLYSKEKFCSRGIALRFIKTKPFTYRQFEHDFVPWLSIIDVMMFNSLDSTGELIRSNYDLI